MKLQKVKKNQQVENIGKCEKVGKDPQKQLVLGGWAPLALVEDNSLRTNKLMKHINIGLVWFIMLSTHYTATVAVIARVRRILKSFKKG